MQRGLPVIDPSPLLHITVRYGRETALRSRLAPALSPSLAPSLSVSHALELARRSLRVEGSALPAPSSTPRPPKSALPLAWTSVFKCEEGDPDAYRPLKEQILFLCSAERQQREEEEVIIFSCRVFFIAPSRVAVLEGCRPMAHGMPAQGKVTIAVDEYSSNPTQAFTHYNINQSRFQPPHVHMVDPIPYDTPKPGGHTRFVCVSDTHSRTDGIQMPYGDVLLHTGDFTELGLPSEVKKFNDWLGSLPYEYKVVIAGNHELTFDKDFMADLVKQDYYRFPSVSKLKPEDFDNVQSLLTNCVYLQDSDATVKGFRIYGTPW
ncbi:hypothetical protein ACEWY4_015266 [Coilia grayii]|uniref:Calcineurin-like phosphoesterase domain-containing protein n=1 Tax=Coilia grayii TaxID=363190 RepID=A0ABD1JMK1_9TELE